MPVMRKKFLGVMAPLRADKDIYTITGGKIGFAGGGRYLHRCIRWKIRIKAR